MLESLNDMKEFDMMRKQNKNTNKDNAVAKGPQKSQCKTTENVDTVGVTAP